MAETRMITKTPQADVYYKLFNHQPQISIEFQDSPQDFKGSNSFIIIAKSYFVWKKIKHRIIWSDFVVFASFIIPTPLVI